jgi:hypothetical protein
LLTAEIIHTNDGQVFEYARGRCAASKRFQQSIAIEKINGSGMRKYQIIERL